MLYSCFAVKILWWKQEITRSSARDMDAFKLMKELRMNYEQEVQYLPKETGLSLIESTMQVLIYNRLGNLLTFIFALYSSVN